MLLVAIEREELFQVFHVVKEVD